MASDKHSSTHCPAKILDAHCVIYKESPSKLKVPYIGVGCDEPGQKGKGDSMCVNFDSPF